MDLADVLTQAIAANCTLINSTGRRWADRPVRLEMSWHPQMNKVDLLLTTLDHLPVFRPRQQPEHDDLGISETDRSRGLAREALE